MSRPCPVICCERFGKALEAAELLCFLTCEPLSGAKAEPAVWILSDDGHGGAEKIDFCPFGGQAIFIQEDVE